MPRYIYLWPAPSEIDMRVPDSVRKCVLFIGVREPDGDIRYGGTAFIVSVPGSVQGTFPYLVTAKHVIEFLGDRPFVVRANLTNGTSAIFEAEAGHWRFHDDATVDAAVSIFAPPPQFDLDSRAIPMSNFLNDEIIAEHRIGPGDQVFITGLFTRAAGSSQNMPIVRMGTVALMPPEKIPHGDGLIDAYLIEHHSIGGLSGSPAFVSETLLNPVAYVEQKKRMPEKMFFFAPGQTFFMGLVRGHWEMPPNPAFGQTEGMNLGISVVVPAQKIREILYQSEQIALRKEIEDERIKDEESGVLDHALPVAQIPEKPFTKDDFEAALKKVARKVK